MGSIFAKRSCFPQPIQDVIAVTVAPHAGAWIETVAHGATACGCLTSPLTQGRGSKLRNEGLHHDRRRSPLTQGRGSKLLCGGKLSLQRGSPLTQGRGSKPALPMTTLTDSESPLTQGRGSKLVTWRAELSCPRSRPSRRGVDRNL